MAESTMVPSQSKRRVVVDRRTEGMLAIDGFYY
jgi:hypothetical protein